MLELIKVIMLIQIARELGMGEATTLIFVVLAGFSYIFDIIYKRKEVSR